MIRYKFEILGLPKSRLPEFTEEESAMLKGSFDFIGMNFYTSEIVFPEESDINDISYYADQDVSSYQVRKNYLKTCSRIIFYD